MSLTTITQQQFEHYRRLEKERVDYLSGRHLAFAAIVLFGGQGYYEDSLGNFADAAVSYLTMAISTGWYGYACHLYFNAKNKLSSLEKALG